MKRDGADVGPLARLVDRYGNVSEAAVIRGRTLVQDCQVDGRVYIGEPVPRGEYSREDRRYAKRKYDEFSDDDKPAAEPPPEYFDIVIVDSQLDPDVRVAAEALQPRDVMVGEAQPIPSKTFVSKSSIGMDSRVGVGVFLEHATIGGFCEIGDGVRIEGTEEEPVFIRSGALVGRNVVIMAGARIGESARVDNNTIIDRGVRISPEFGWGGAGRRVILTKPVDELIGYIPGMTPSAWVMERLAEIAAEAPKERLTKAAVRNERPELLNLAVTKDLLRIQPPVTAPQLRDAAEESMTSYPKYEVYLTRKGWGGHEDVGEREGVPLRYAVLGGQVLATRDNDVLAFDLTKEAVRYFAEEEDPEDPQEMALREAVLLEALMMGKQDWHPGGTSLHNVGWARAAMYPEHRAMMVEEIQTDLAVITKAREYADLDREYVGLPGIVRTTDRANKILGEQVFAASASQRKWSTDPVITKEDLRIVMFEVASFLSDFYATAMAYLLVWAKEQGFESVYYPDFKTKEAMAASPPKSIYERLPKRFQGAPVVDPPEWLGWSWGDAAGTPPHPDHPRFRRMRPNEQ